MARTSNGCGTTYYGRRDKAADGSYVTTEFFCIFYFPLLPLRSWRVLPVEYTRSGFSSTQTYRATRVPLNWRQVVNVYLVPICTVGGAILLGFVLRLIEGRY